MACIPGASEEKIEALKAVGVTVLITKENEGHVDLTDLMEEIGKMKIDSILLEGGGTLADAAFKAGIIDKVQFYIAPEIIGGRTAMTPVGGSGIARLSDAARLSDLSVRNVGNDICITGYVEK